MSSEALVLIAERDQRVRDFQKFFLERAGLIAEFVDDGEAALDRTRALRPAVVVAEILIPRIDGLALCRRLRADPDTAHIPVIIFSVLAASVRAREAGASAFLPKPLVESIFVATVRAAMAAQPGTAMEQQ
ncbi:hypothetical protein BH23GEM9_BH23GEM9_08240 [soil metagenome]